MGKEAIRPITACSVKRLTPPRPIILRVLNSILYPMSLMIKAMLPKLNDQKLFNF